MNKPNETNNQQPSLKEGKSSSWKTIAHVSDGEVTLTAPIGELTNFPTLVSDEDGKRVSIKYGEKSKKSLKINLYGHKPEFEFTGLWSGKDIQIIIRHIRKAYYQNTRTLRRQNIATNKKQPNPASIQGGNDE